ncbi:unnamed protein product [Rotaria sp. Silwood2]|nr:unnamed protein product [Rotaria sp. Silwood2]CAF3003870.1 unnamed protein product [Rotaria sp. Silwood2]CAF3923127.1 unnamed protein product [Rotaria sp. Silwood2]CAF4442787.1 unnamed protein product [Rotaria sp. Silwood2]
MEQDATITRKALGRAAFLGDLYDARKEEFCGLSLLKSELPATIISNMDVPSTRLEYDFSDTFEEKFNKLDVQAQLKINVLAGLFKLEGSGKYLGDEKKSYKSVKCTLIYDIRTKEETFTIGNEKLEKLISYDAIKMPDATHVVVGIKWGANVFASFEFENKENYQKKYIEGILQANMEKIALSIKGSGSVQFTEDENQLKTSLSIKFFGDIIPQDEELPQTFEKTLELMKKVPSYLTKFNNGKGKPLEYTLYPLKNVEKFFQLETRIKRTLIDLNLETITLLEKEFDDLLQAKQKFNDFYNEVNENSDFVASDNLGEIYKKSHQIKTCEAAFREQIATKLVEVRSGTKKPITIEKILTKFHEKPGFIMDISAFIEKYTKLITTIKQIAVFKENKIIYLGKRDASDVLPMQNNGDIYLFYMNEELKIRNNQLYEDSYHYFLDLVRDVEKKQSKFVIIDYNIHPEVKTKKEIKICYYRNGKLVADDLYKSKKESLSWCIAKSQLTSSTLRKPATTTKLSIPCAGIKLNYHCPREKKTWTCEKCQTSIEYGYDNTFYCSCGGAAAESYSFKCSSPLHPDEFLTFTKDDLERYLPNKDAENEVNILLLGETGVGKSTFINAFINYLTFSSLEEAAKEELRAGIFTKFIITDDNCMERTIKIGYDDSECTVEGQSSTQYAKAHVFHIDDLTLRIIDTPGIGDTRGIEMDKQNLQNTLSYISNYGHLNGICILLKPNNSRLNLEFRYCIKELLTNLHKKATDNIVFCFTNCRGTFYKPGDTLPALRTLLKDLEEQSGVSIPLQSNIFCFDNESFRFLAALKQGVQFNDDDKSDFSKSWTRSVKMTENMISYILKCPTHKIKETITLNESRSLIMELCKPIAEISQNIQLNIKLAQDRKKELAANELSINELEDKLYIPQVELVPVSLDYPRTVCTQPKCTKVVTSNGIAKVDYLTHCHPHCYLQGVPPNTIDHSALRKCDAMVNGICKICGCSWTTHMHITYENKQEIKYDIDDNVQKMIREKTSNYELIVALNNHCDRLIEELQYEQGVITKIAAKFAYFTRKNAIAVFNDDLENYLEHLIKEEEGKRSAGSQNSSIIDGLKTMKNSYKEQQRVFDQAIRNNREYEEVELSQIPQLVGQLYSLTHNGEQLKQIVEELKYGKCRAIKFKEEKHDIIPKRSNKKDNVIVAGIKHIWKTVY